jgi:hypothetical protein
MALEMMKEQIRTALLAEKREAPLEISLDKLLEPSIFDSVDIMDLKKMAKEVRTKLTEDLMNGSSLKNAEMVDKMRQNYLENKAEPQVSAGFSKKPANADQFTTVKFTKKRKQMEDVSED